MATKQQKTIEPVEPVEPDEPPVDLLPAAVPFDLLVRTQVADVTIEPEVLRRLRSRCSMINRPATEDELAEYVRRIVTTALRMEVGW